MVGTEEYLAWNAAIADVAYPVVDVPTAAYLDMEESVLSDIADRLNIEGGAVGAEADLVEVNRWALGVQSDTSIDFDRVLALVTRWAAREERHPTGSPPPLLPTLALLSLAAERMASSSSMSDTNFYGRLNELLGVRKEDQRVRTTYRRVAERLWRTLNLWLDHRDGARGVPTAFALGHRYVGLPMSQALLRQADQERLPAFFAEYGFAAGSSVPPEALTTSFDEWLQSRDVISNHVRRAWATSKSAVAEGIAAHLATWDGSLPDDRAISRRAGRGIRLVLDLRSFPSRRLHLEPQIPVSGTEPATAMLETAEGQVHVDLISASPGWASFTPGAQVANDALLNGELRLRLEGGDETFAHRPRRIMAFHQDETSARWTSTNSVQLGQDLLLLVRSELLAEVEPLLDECARPGWQWARDLKGLPSEWRLAQGVQVFRRPPFEGFNDLALLTPPVPFHTELAGGFRIPGTTKRTWHVSDPPEIRISAESELTAHLVSEGSSMAAASTDQDVWSGTTAGGLLAQPLDQLGVDVGTYRVEVTDSRKKILASNRFQLVNGDRREVVRWADADPVHYDLQHPLGALGVPSDDDSAGTLQGMILSPNAQVRQVDVVDLPKRRRWEGPLAIAAATPKQRLILIGLPETSCLYTGRHVEHVDTVPTDGRGKPLIKHSYGRCRGCGLERRYRTHLPKNGRTVSAPPTVRAKPKDLLPTMSGAGAHHPWDLLLDALFFLGRGTAREFDRVVANIEPGALFSFRALNLLESLGHIDVSRDPASLEVVSWEISPTSAVRTGDEWRLVGYWPNELTDSLATRHGLSLLTLENADAPTNWYSSDPSDADVVVVDAPQPLLLEHLPPLVSVVAELPRRTMPATETSEWCDPSTGRWAPAGPMTGRGAFRVNAFASRYFLRTPEDVDADTVAVASAALAKHSAPVILGREPLLAYDPATGSLLVPLGCELPGLYGRAIVGTAGLPPYRSGGSLVYPEVPPGDAKHLAWLFSTKTGDPS